MNALCFLRLVIICVKLDKHKNSIFVIMEATDIMEEINTMEKINETQQEAEAKPDVLLNEGPVEGGFVIVGK